KACIDAGVRMRAVRLGTQWQKREPTYDQVAEDKRLADRMTQAQERDFPAARPEAAQRRRTIRWCTRCVYPSIGAAP
ncbi:MAG: hypothetical protein JZU55_13235, partial [Afipia sp.]|nr:hypothetical protein [Afipia sp.]